MPPMITWVMILFGLWLAYLCITSLLQKKKNLKHATTAASWPSVMGKVVTMEVSEGRYRSSESGQMVNTYWPKVTYAYTVGGKELTAERIAFGKVMYYQPSEAEAFKQTYAVGKSVPVFYDPAAPQDAVLDRDPAHATKLVFADFGMLIFGLVLFGIGLGGLLGKW